MTGPDLRWLLTVDELAALDVLHLSEEYLGITPRSDAGARSLIARGLVVSDGSGLTIDDELDRAVSVIAAPSWLVTASIAGDQVVIGHLFGRDGEVVVEQQQGPIGVHEVRLTTTPVRDLLQQALLQATPEGSPGRAPLTQDSIDGLGGAIRTNTVEVLRTSEDGSIVSALIWLETGDGAYRLSVGDDGGAPIATPVSAADLLDAVTELVSELLWPKERPR